jgi:CheY-like chemotaxis protein
MILDIEIGQDSGIDFFGQLSEQKECIPTILYAERELTLFEKKILLFYEKNCLPGKNAITAEQLLEEVTLFLHKISLDLSKGDRGLQQTHHKEALLAHKKILLVDDDVRNTFALSTVLDEKNMKVLAAKNGKEALKLLASQPDIDLVLMDIMMPEMDGYETINKIRQQDQFRELPIIALTAKAMKGDKNKCIEAGANDYLAKPVDIEKLLSLMRVWLYHH